MAFKLILLAAVLQLAACKPTLTLEDLEVADDVVAVGSYVREVRAAAPQDYHKSYQNEGDGEIGYSRKKQGGGKKGYQHFDSYHKKAGDNYEFEKQDSFGHDDGGNQGAYSHNHERKEKGDIDANATSDIELNNSSHGVEPAAIGDKNDHEVNNDKIVAFENTAKDFGVIDGQGAYNLNERIIELGASDSLNKKHNKRQVNYYGNQGAYDNQYYGVVKGDDDGRNYDYEVSDDDETEGRSAKIRRPRPWKIIRRLIRWFF